MTMFGVFLVVVLGLALGLLGQVFLMARFPAPRPVRVEHEPDRPLNVMR